MSDTRKEIELAITRIATLEAENARMRRALEVICGRDETGIPSFMPVEVAAAALATESEGK